MLNNSFYFFQLNTLGDQPVESTVEADVLYTKILEGLANSSIPNSVYGANLDTTSLGKSLLTNAPFNIDPNRDGVQLDESVGINKSTKYLGGNCSGTPLHCEDGFMDSLNVCFAGKDKAMKLWLFIHPQSTNKVIEYLRDKVRDLKNDDGLCDDVQSAMSIWEVGCAAPHHHKSLFILPSLLRELNIQYEIIPQYPGDVVYVGPGILHQVVNVGVTLAEAVNVGGPLWNSMSCIFMTCACQGKEIQYIQNNYKVCSMSKNKDV